MGERRDRERHEMRERIIDAARRLFVTEGYERTTLRRIAEEIEYTPGAIYAYFKDKDAILYALHQHGFEDLGRRMTEVVVGATSPLDALGRTGRAYIKFARDNPEMYDLMFIAQATSRAMHENVWPEGTRVYDGLRGLVKAALDGGWIAGGDPEAIAFLLWSTVHGMASLEIRDRCMVIPEAERARVHTSAYQILLDRISMGKVATATESHRAKPRRASREL